MNGSLPYLVAGFGLTWVVVAVYAWRLEARLGRTRERLRRHGQSDSRVEAPAGSAAGAAGGPAGSQPNDGPEEAR